MRKLALLTVVILMAAATSLKAQSLQNTAWKAYLDPVHDTLTLHIGKDSSFVTDSGGEVVVRSVCKVTKDTLSLRDYEGKYFCPDGEGIYKVAVIGDALNFTLVNDPCEGRNNSISGTKWIRVVDKH
jgi:hypothetical protein